MTALGQKQPLVSLAAEWLLSANSSRSISQERGTEKLVIRPEVLLAVLRHSGCPDLVPVTSHSL